MLYSYIFALLLHIFAFICKLGVRNIDSKHKLCKKMNVMSCAIFKMDEQIESFDGMKEIGQECLQQNYDH